MKGYLRAECLGLTDVGSPPCHLCQFSISWLQSTWLCLKRQARITFRDRVFLRSRVVQVGISVIRYC
jgi:hypothetical protein